uniref:Interleukin 4/13A n=1 Tax=Echeneis naucrates TaxID=173247 RepID=A0A665UIT9_ECHNA
MRQQLVQVTLEKAITAKMMLLLLSAVALLVSPAVATPVHHNYSNFSMLASSMFKLAESCNANLTEDKFFCKVQDVLTNTEIVRKNTDMWKLNRTLHNYNREKKVNCGVELQGVKNSDEITLPSFFKYVMQCIQRRNFRRHN